MNALSDDNESANDTMTRAKPVPHFRQVAQRIADQIADGALVPGTKIPAERKLAEEFGISRMTARAAVEHLAQRGLVERKDRSGTYVARPKVRVDLSATAGLSDQFLGVGIVPGATLIAATTDSAFRMPKAVASSLDLSPEEQVHRVVRRRTGNGEPLLLEESYFPKSVFPGLLAHDLTAHSIYSILKEEYGQNLNRFEQELEQVQLDVDTAAILEARPDAMALRVTRTVWNLQGTPVEFARDYYRSDRIVFISAASN